uniref:Uncharacterized protein AlNc14C188G8367 n=1 Tax=Albugo laibachii Nc14 TaxID=890382 RepID=F0WFM8_9STRA|nr:conserved hypothetical protein [Albugo laibachii Nc14]CCA23272.1 conserved hypothetical protein [Albugo laibachii Nc14]|eukprot:CCA23272.1 conserved hypothetical protein [Albugo laibachii Nc14]
MESSIVFEESDCEESPHFVPSPHFSHAPSRCGGERITELFEYSPNQSKAPIKHSEQYENEVADHHFQPIVHNPSSDNHSREPSVRMMDPRISLQQLQQLGVKSKRVLIQQIRRNSMQFITMNCQAVLVCGPAKKYYTYHIDIASDFYKQKWVVCKRFSELYRLRKKVLTHLQVHARKCWHNRTCKSCDTIYHALKSVGFPNRLEIFQDMSALITRRVTGIEEFLVSMCQLLATGTLVNEDDMITPDASCLYTCAELNKIRRFVKEILHFPLGHENQHVRAIRELNYVDYRDMTLESESCPICLAEWRDLDGHQLVQAACSHCFHEHCIREWYGTRFDCPMCRSIAGIARS